MNPIALLLLSTIALFGQVSRRPEFEVVDVKLNVSASPDGVGEILPSGQFRASNIPVKELIKFAFNLRDEAVVGAPGWAASERYDVFGKARPRALRKRSGARIRRSNSCVSITPTRPSD